MQTSPGLNIQISLFPLWASGALGQAYEPATFSLELIWNVEDLDMSQLFMTMSLESPKAIFATDRKCSVRTKKQTKCNAMIRNEKWDISKNTANSAFLSVGTSYTVLRKILKYYENLKCYEKVYENLKPTIHGSW